MLLKVVRHGVFQDIPIKQGEVFLLEGGTPHNPVRFADTIGIVIERPRPTTVLDALRWYCQNPTCRAVIHEAQFHVSDLVVQLKEVIEHYQSDVKLRTCGSCGHISEP